MFSKKYTKLNKDQIPRDFELYPVTYRENNINKYDVVLIHRTLSINFGEPTEFEWEIVEKISETKMRGRKTEWQYYIKTDSDEIIQIATKNLHTSITINYLTPISKNQPTLKQIKSCNQFIDDFLTEIIRLEKALMNEDENFSHSIQINLYLIDNIYLQNYMCGEYLLTESPGFEDAISKKALKYDSRENEVREDDEKMMYIDKNIMLKGLFWASTISFFFFAFEGFINMLYYSFLKDKYRKNGFKISVWENGKNKQIDIHKIDIEKKLKELPKFCDGLKKNGLDRSTLLSKDFRNIKIYRNKLFHSSLKDNLKRILVTQDDFLYYFDVDNLRKSILPSRRYNLTHDDAKKVKRILDTTIKHTINLFEDKYKRNIDIFILNKLRVPFIQDGFGNVKLLGLYEPNQKLENL